MVQLRFFKILSTLACVLLTGLSCSSKEKIAETSEESKVDFVLIQHLDTGIPPIILVEDSATGVLIPDSDAYPILPHWESGIPEREYVTTPELAFKIAEAVLKDNFGEKDIESEKPFSIYLDNGLWRITGYKDPDMYGGATHIDIKTTGEIMGVWQTK
jgi:hypothetical protein